jgi:hypothetical protein
VYFHKTGDSDTDYLVDHSIIMYLIDPAGEFVTFYGEQPESHMLRAIWVLGFRVWGTWSVSTLLLQAVLSLKPAQYSMTIFTVASNDLCASLISTCVKWRFCIAKLVDVISTA